MMERISPDERLRAIALLLIPGFVGHFIQLVSEDVPWAPWARARCFHTPGWHLYLPAWVPWAVLIGLGLAVVGLAARRTRGWLLAIAALYAAHYVTYPFRIRNHMTLMLAELAMLAGVWCLGDRARPRRVARAACDGMAMVLCITYAFAALHKINDRFLSLGAESAAIEGLTTFWIYGDLGSSPPWIARIAATYGTVVLEAMCPIVAWRSARLRVPAILALFAFHVPHVAVMDVADYPMIASAFYPALFSRAHFRGLWRELRRPGAWNLGGAALGAGVQLWFMPWWGGLTTFGLLVLAIWGYAAGSMLRRIAAHGWARARAPAVVHSGAP